MVFGRKLTSPTVTKDGVVVAKEIELADACENLGAQMVREVASKTSHDAADGTTPAILLAEVIYREGLSLRTETQLAFGAASKKRWQRPWNTSTRSKKVNDKEEIKQVATVSVNWDSDIGVIIADAMEKVGKDRTITVAAAQSLLIR